MIVVIDASVMVSLLVNRSPEAVWAQAIFETNFIVAPDLLQVEVTNTLRKLVSIKELTTAQAKQAMQDLLDFNLEFYEFAPFANRVWELRDNFSAYDAWYLAVAEAVNAPLATLDFRMRNAMGSRCEFLVPE